MRSFSRDRSCIEPDKFANIQILSISVKITVLCSVKMADPVPGTDHMTKISFKRSLVRSFLFTPAHFGYKFFGFGWFSENFSPLNAFTGIHIGCKVNSNRLRRANRLTKQLKSWPKQYFQYENQNRFYVRTSPVKSSKIKL